MSYASWAPPSSPQQGVNLETFILEGMLETEGATGTFTALLNQICLATKLITSRVRRAGLSDLLGYTGETNVQGEQVQKLDIIANDLLINTLRRQGHCSALASEELADPVVFPHASGGYLVVTDPLDGSSNIDVDISIGTIFGVLRHDLKTGPPTTQSFLQKGRDLVAAGYVIYGSSTVLVLTTGNGVHGFTWDPSVGEFFLSHNNIRTPSRGNTYSINEGNTSRWSPGVKAWNEYIKSVDPEKNLPYGARYVGSMVADAHRTLLRGGMFAYPADTKSPGGKLRLLYEANPFAMIFEAAGGKATNGNGTNILDIKPTELHMRVPLVLGSTEDVDTFESFTKNE